MSVTPQAIIRPIRPEDDSTIATIIRIVMPEFGARGPGFAINDPEVDYMSRAYLRPRSVYFVSEFPAGRLIGGAGLAPLEGGDGETCELRKMYMLAEGRGHGLGERLARLCIEAARSFGYRRCYLETLSTMDAAQQLYRKLGFAPISAPMGATGHFSCDRYYVLELGALPRGTSQRFSPL